MNKKFGFMCVAFVAYALGQGSGWSADQVNQAQEVASFDAFHQRSVQELVTAFSSVVDQMKALPTVEPDDQVGCGVGAMLADFGEANGIDTGVFYNLTNYMHSLSLTHRNEYLNQIGIGDGTRETLGSFREGLDIVERNFDTASLDQKCFLLLQMDQWLIWIEDILDAQLYKGYAPQHNWYGTDNYELLDTQVAYKYSSMFLNTLLLLK